MNYKLSRYLYHEYTRCKQRFWGIMNDAIEWKEEEVDSQTAFFQLQATMLIERALPLLQSLKPAASFEAYRPVETPQLKATAPIYEYHPKFKSTAIYEVRTSKTIKKYHLWDLAFLAMVFLKAGEPLKKMYIIHMNPDYVLHEEANEEQLLKVVDVSKKVWEKIKRLQRKVEKVLDYALVPEHPPTSIQEHSCRSLNCQYLKQFYKDQPLHPVFELKGLNREQLQELLDQGVEDMLDVPEAYLQTELQKRQIQLAASSQPLVNQQKLAGWLSSLRYPIYFLDYEALSAAIPMYVNTRSYQHVVFQYSLHRIAAPGAKAQHFQFLASNKNMPYEELLKALFAQLEDDEGTVLVWHDSFEKARHREMASYYPEYSDYLMRLNDRIVDMEVIFKMEEAVFLHPEFKGRSSIKTVLPILCPEVDGHQQLAISDGMSAAIQWFHYLNDDLSEEAETQMRKDLEAYCYMDTYAMVLLLDFLQKNNP